MKVLVVDDHALFREGLRLILNALDPDVEVVLTSSVDEAIAQAHRHPFNLVLLDWNLDKGRTGADALSTVRDALPLARIVILSGEKSAALIRNVVEQGAVGFIPKDIAPDRLMDALQTIAEGGIFLPATVLSGVESGAKSVQGGDALRDITNAFPALTHRQGEVLCATLRGLPNKLIARELSISDATVKTHLSVIFRELGVQSRTEAVYVAARHGVRIS